MPQQTLASLVAALPSTSDLALSERSRLIPPAAVDPFVVPELDLLDGDDFDCDLIFIEAPAAVGKSTLARYLAHQLGCPLLDLSRTRVSTDSLAGLLRGVSHPPDAITSFLAGHLSIIVDGLDEGQLLSGQRNFEEFLTTTWDLLASRTASGPSIVFLGRPETIALTEVSVQLDSDQLTSRRCRLGYFGESSARSMVLAYARRADTTGQIDQHGDAANAVVDSFFSSIERALRLDIGTLWSDHNGRRFAGYAPVLATLGGVLAGSTNYAELGSRLSAAGHETAWSVVEDVCDAVFEREQSKVAGPLESRCSGPVPPNAYDRTEQVRALTAKVTKAPVESALRVSFSNPGDTDIYRQVVATFVSEHPFLHEGRISSDVLGSVLFADAIHNGLPIAAAEVELEGLGRQPFLWRSFERNTPAKLQLSGLVIGALISSLRADERPELVCVDPGPDPGTYTLRLGDNGPSSADFTSPLVLGDGLSNARITCDDVRLAGSGASTPSVRLRGPLEIVARTLTVAAAEVVLSGSIWLDAGVFIPVGPVRVERSGNGGTRLGFGGALASSHPWSGLTTELVSSPFSDDASADPLVTFLQTCSDHLPAGAPIVLNLDLSPTDDTRVRWASREYGEVFEKMVGLMITHGLATSERFAASGSAKRRIRFPKSWDALINSVMADDAEVQEFARGARELLKP